MPIGIEQAEKIATDFVKKRKTPQEVTVRSVQPQDNGWLVKGSYPITGKYGSGSEKFTVQIDDEGNIVSYEFEPGFYVAVI